MLRVDGENWLRLNLAARDAVRMRSLVKKYGTATELLEQKPNELFSAGEIDGALLGKLVFARSREMDNRIGEIVTLCRKNGWRIITPQSELYPERLLELRRFPFVLYADGDVELLNAPLKCSIVGTRNASQKACTVAYKFAYGLSQLGVAVVSGGALGIDAASHEGALSGKTGTIGVLGAGLGSGYLQKNADLRSRISSHGVLISELEPFESPSRYTFPERNRIIASLGDACLVAESGANGGSLITAELARREGRRVFVPSHEIIVSDGCKNLLESGAVEVDSPAGFFREIAGTDADENDMRNVPTTAAPDYDIDFTLPGFKRYFFCISAEEQDKNASPQKEKKQKTATRKKTVKSEETTSLKPERRLFTAASEPTLFSVAPMTDGERRVLDVIDETPVSLDKIVEMSGLGTDIVSSSLTLLELRGTVSSYYGNLYSLRENHANAK